ncbi:MAG TPA: hypothetical protein VMI56_12665 [Reyranella sp.]|nr:hypothetical protein [Reyranella sp.]
MRHLFIGAVMVLAALLATVTLASWLETMAVRRTAPRADDSAFPAAPPLMPFSKPNPSEQSRSVNLVYRRGGKSE